MSTYSLLVERNPKISVSAIESYCVQKGTEEICCAESLLRMRGTRKLV